MIKLALIVSLVLGVVSVLVDVQIMGRPIPGLDAALGFFGCVAIILVSKWMGKRVIQRRADYYEREEEGAGA